MTNIDNSQANLANKPQAILVLGTGGTIAGLGGDAYTAAQLPINALLAPFNDQVVSEQIAQIDSKDMCFAVWDRLYARLSGAILDAKVGAIVITHGTDTLEETAFFLHRAVACTKPVILTGAMRPADDPAADGPRNLADALAYANSLTAGVWVVLAGQALPAYGVQKNHPQALEAFGQRESNSTQVMSRAPFKLSQPVQRWPRVEIVMNYAGASGLLIEALIQQHVDGIVVDGIVVAGTGNGTVSDALDAALHKALQAGIAVRLTTRCLQGSVIQNANHAFDLSPLSPVQARVDLMLDLMQANKEH